MTEDAEIDEKEEKEDIKGEEQKEKKPLKDKKEKMIKVKESEHVKAIEDVAEYKDKYIRLYAEFENVRKRMERDKQEFIKYANAGILAEFLSILDNLERSVAAAKEKHQDYDAFLKGVEMVMAHVHEMLKKNDVKPIEAKGKMFDPHSHEVLLQEENDEVEEGTVIEEFQKGYYFLDKVIRTSKVKVAKKKE